MKNSIVARKNYVLFNLWKLLFWIGFRYENYRLSFALSFDPYPNFGWKNNIKDCPGIEFRKR